MTSLKVSFATVRKGTTYIRKVIDDNVIKRLTTAKLLGLPFKEIDPEKDQRWNAKKINAELLQAIEQGEAISEIGERLMRVTNMNKNSAIRNARTMTTSFENLGRLDGMEAMQKIGTKLRKKWLATHDSRVRDAHAEMDGDVVSIDEPFHSSEFGGIDYPGDPNAEAGNIYNCRCTLTYVIDGFEPTLPEGTILGVE